MSFGDDSIDQESWLTPIIIALSRLRQEDLHEFNQDQPSQRSTGGVEITHKPEDPTCVWIIRILAKIWCGGMLL